MKLLRVVGAVDKILEVRRVNIVVNVEFIEGGSVAAATYSKKGREFYVPEGRLLPSSKSIKLDSDSQVVVDYNDFIESVTDLITDFYNLKIYYKNKSKDYSHYFGMLVKDSNNNIIIDFDFTLRVSNHPPKRSKSSQKQKKDRKHALQELTGDRPTKPIVKSVIVNENKFSSYMDAYEYVDTLIEEVVISMKRRQKYR